MSAIQRASNIIIIGGGLGGLTAANAILQLKGPSVKVFDKRRDFAPRTSSGFALQPNGYAILDTLGFGKQIEDAAAVITKRRTLSAEGTLLDLEAYQNIQNWKERYGYPLVGLMRTELMHILAKPLQDGGHLHMSKELDRLEQYDGGVRCFFTDGTMEKGDLVIGCDGVNSTVAKLMFGGLKIPPLYANNNMWYGTIVSDPYDFKNPLLATPNQLLQVFGEGHSLFTMPCGPNGRVWGLAYHSTEAPDHTEWDADQEFHTLEDHVAGLFHGEHPAMELVLRTSVEQVIHFGLFYRVTKPTWHIGRIALLGDACHATLPYAAQGANMAMEDGLVLAECLQAKEYDIQAALASYQYMRYDRTRSVARKAALLGKIELGSGLLLGWLRNLAIRKGDRWLARRLEREVLGKCPVPLGPRH
eukprot:comp17565_c0_seq1/m.17170 comp17565_c0_seq1/g.17170  ORF comp17565_c0_seq1/g.17170 comp17565_c0_seq1/m.17170 type:complete len:416 (-) comp17565_c0_seq1:509-1756(-)